MRRATFVLLLCGSTLLACSSSVPSGDQSEGETRRAGAQRAAPDGDLPKPMPAEEARIYAEITDRLNAGLILEPGSLDKVIGLDLKDRDLRGSSLSDLKRLSSLQKLDLTSNRRITDAHLEHLKGLTALRELRLSDTQVTGGGLAHLLPISGLRLLDLSGTHVHDPGLRYVARFSELQELMLTHCGITDAGLADLQGLKKLTALHLWKCRVTDKGLSQLKALTSLQRLDVRHTDVTDAGKRDLQKALPKLQFLGDSDSQSEPDKAKEDDTKDTKKKDCDEP